MSFVLLYLLRFVCSPCRDEALGTHELPQIFVGGPDLSEWLASAWRRYVFCAGTHDEIDFTTSIDVATRGSA